MKWKTNTRRHYDAAWRKVFAWTPKRCDDGSTRWLCFVARVSRFTGGAYYFVYRPIYKGATRNGR